MSAPKVAQKVKPPTARQRRGLLTVFCLVTADLESMEPARRKERDDAYAALAYLRRLVPHPASSSGLPEL